MSPAIGKAKASAAASARGGRRGRRRDKEEAAYDRRLRAAGIVPIADPDKDIDAFRNQMARRIHMFINSWHGCPERLCKRNRGCMAPDIQCANVPQPTPEQIERDLPRAQAEFYKALKAEIAKRGEEDA